jgi:biotin carboxylase
MSDKIKPNLKTRVALSLNYPAKVTNSEKGEIENLVSAALDALKIENGIAHTEVIIDKTGTPFLVETGARGGGGHIFHTIIEEVSGINAPVLQALWLTGNKLNIGNIKSAGCCYRFFNPRRGILKNVKNTENVWFMEGVLDFGILKKAGEEVGNLENSLQRTGFVVTSGSDRNDAIAKANQVEDILVFEVIEKNEY